MASIHDNFESPIEKKYKLGFQLGGFAKIGLSEKLYVQPELLYSLQGAKFDLELSNIIQPVNDSDPLFSEGSLKSNQQESNFILPVMLQYYLADKFLVEFGPQLDFLFHTKLDGERETNTGIVDENESYNNETDFYFGLNLGIGYHFNENMGLNLRYNYGFNRLEKSALGSYKSNNVSRNSVFSLSLEYQFVK